MNEPKKTDKNFELKMALSCIGIGFAGIMGAIWAGFYLVHVFSGTWQEKPIILSFLIVLAVSALLLILGLIGLFESTQNDNHE